MRFNVVLGALVLGAYVVTQAMAFNALESPWRYLLVFTVLTQLAMTWQLWRGRTK